MTIATLSDADVQKIVDDHAPNQGDPWDMAAMLRVAYAAGAAAQREADAKICDKLGAVSTPDERGIIWECAQAIRAAAPTRGEG